MLVNFNEGEKIIFEVRKHWFVLAVDLIFSALFMILPIIVLVIMQFVPFVEINFEGNSTLVLFALYGLWLLGVWTSLFVLWTDYYLDIWIITNKRLIDVEQKGLFSREVAILELTKIQDVTSEVNGFVATALGFGDITVQTASVDREFTIRRVAAPNTTTQKISEALKDSRQGVEIN